MIIQTFTKVARSCLIYTFLAALAAFAPFLGMLENLQPLIGTTYGKDYQIFESFGLTATIIVVAVAAWHLRRKPLSWTEALPVLLPTGVSLFWLFLFSEYSVRSWDYYCYENAARAFLAGDNPYQGCYFYPPLVMYGFSGLYTGIQLVSMAFRGIYFVDEKAWLLVFYFYQCVQWLLIIAAYFLNHRLAIRFGVPKMLALGVVTALFIINNPLLRTFRYNQINLWLLDLVCLALLLSSSHPVWSGFLAAVGGHIKLYPFLLAVPWVAEKKWKAVFGVVGGTIFILIASLGGLGSSKVWLQFADFFRFSPRGILLRDNSLHSLFYNIVRVFGGNQLDAFDESLMRWLPVIFSVVVTIGFMVRWNNRRRLLRQNVLSEEAHFLQKEGSLVDMIGMMLLVSPMVWEHHYIMMLPFALWALGMVIENRESPYLTGASIFLIFCIPTFDIFPFSYHRLFGLALLLWCTSPARILKEYGKRGSDSSGWH